MDLLDYEKQEYNQLIKKRKEEPLNQQEQQRIFYLQLKKWHNECQNPQCTKYEGGENETHCPKCKRLLFKFKDI